MHKQRTASAATALLGIISTMLPWGSFLGISVSGLSAGMQGYLVLIAFVVGLVFSLMGDRNDVIKDINLIATSIAGGLAGVLGIILLLGNISFAGIGLYLTVICGIGLLLIPRFVK